MRPQITINQLHVAYIEHWQTGSIGQLNGKTPLAYTPTTDRLLTIMPHRTDTCKLLQCGKYFPPQLSQAVQVRVNSAENCVAQNIK